MPNCTVAFFIVRDGARIIAQSELESAWLPFGTPWDFWFDMRALSAQAPIRLHLLAELAAASDPPFAERAFVIQPGEPVPTQPRVSFGPAWVAPARFAASSEYAVHGRLAAHAFGTDDDAFWASDGTSVTGQWLEFVCEPPQRLNRMLIKARRDADVMQSPREFALATGAESGPLTDIAMFTTSRWRLGEQRIFEFETEREFARYRVVFKKCDSNHIAVSKLRFGYEL